MFFDMRYYDAYAKNVNIGCENKKLNWEIFMLLKQHYGYLMLFVTLTT